MNQIPSVAASWTAVVLLCSVSFSSADVVINEISAESSDRLLRYHENGNQSVGSGTPWWAPGFDDRTWQAGALPAGHGASPATDLRSAMRGRTPSFYVRKTFTANAAAAAATGLTLSMNYNDGVTVWLNGTEIVRSNMGAEQAHFYFDQESSRSGSTSQSFVDFDASAFADALVEGVNLIAVHVCNSSLTGSTWLDFSLTAGGVEVIPAGAEARVRPGLSEPSGGVADFGAMLDDEVSPGFSDWIELHNNGAAAVDLSGWSLSDELALPDKWKFPQGTMIEPDGYLLVLADALPKEVPTAHFLHANFKLSSSGEFLGLFDAGGGAVSKFDPGYPSHDVFHSYGLAAGGSFVFFSQPTPGAVNGGPEYSDYVDAPDFDQKGGFYDAAVMVTLTSKTEGALIRYTNDGTEPTPSNGMDYTEPLNLERVSDDEGHVIRARAFATGMIDSRVKTNTYLIEQDEGLRTAPALIYSADLEKKLYDPYGVLAIRGGRYSGGNWAARADGDYNYAMNRGRAYERKIHAEYYFADGSVGFRTDCGVRIAASNWSRPRMTLNSVNRSPWPSSSTEKPSFNLFFRGDYGNPSVSFPLNGPAAPVDEFEGFRVRAGKNDISNPFVVDELVRRLHRDMGNVATTGVFNSLYVNGELKGYYNLCERLRPPFFKAHYGTAPGVEWDVLAFGNPNSNIADGDKDAWNDMIRLMRDDVTPENWEKVLQVADVAGIIDYYLVNIYAAMWDWPHNNWVAARERSENGRYRLYVWDAEGGFGNAGDSAASKNLIDGSLDSGGGELQVLWQRLKRWPQFQLLFADRVNKHMFNGGVLDDQDWDTSHLKKRTEELVTEFEDLQRAVTNQRLSVVSLIQRWTRATSGRRANLLGPRRDALSRNDLWPDTPPPEFSQFGGSVPEGFGLRITNETGVIHFTTNGEDPRLPSGEPNPGATTQAGSKLDVSLIEAGSAWRYNDAGEDLGTAWRGDGYDDSGWQQGNAPLGYGGITGTDIATQVNVARNPTTYFRRAIEIDDASAMLSLTAQVHADAGCILYINGQEALRDGLPDGEIAYATLGSSDGNEGVFDTFEIDPALLKTGTNIFAIAHKNQTASGGGSDMVMDLSLAGTRTNPDNAAIPIMTATTVKARSLNDGEWSALTEAIFTVNTTPATSDNIAIAELLYNPSGATDAEIALGITDGDEFEFLEIRNIGSQNVDLIDVSFTDGVAFDFADGSITSIAPDDHVIVVGNLAAFRARYGTAYDSMIAGEYVGSLNNGGENVRLTGTDGVTLHEFEYMDSQPWPIEADAGNSLQIVNASGDHADPANWKSSSTIGGNPGPDGDAVPNLTLTQWQASFFSVEELQNASLSGPDADADADLVSNFAEFVFGTSPRDVSDRPVSPRSSLVEDASGNNYIAVTVTLPADARAITLSGEVSTDLAAWSGIALEEVNSNPLPDGRVEVTYRDVTPAVPGSDRYLRLRMTAE